MNEFIKTLRENGVLRRVTSSNSASDATSIALLFCAGLVLMALLIWAR